MRFLAFFLLASATLLPASNALAQYPDRPVRIIVAYAAGGTADILTRLMAERLDRRLGQRFIVENRPGASGAIGTQAGATAAPDGYTLTSGNISSHGINASVFKSLPYDPVKDFAAITMIAATPNVLIVHPSLGVNDLAGFIKLAKEQPDKIDFGSSSTGGSPHMSGELLKVMAGINMNHVPYRGGGPMLNDLIAGHIKSGFDNLPSASAHIRNGTIKALALTTPQRFPSFPEVPTMAEAGVPGYEVASWFGLFAPAQTPRAVIDKIQQNIAAILAEPEMKARLEELGAIPGGMSPEAFGEIVRREVAKWPDVVAKTGVKVE